MAATGVHAGKQADDAVGLQAFRETDKQMVFPSADQADAEQAETHAIGQQPGQFMPLDAAAAYPDIEQPGPDEALGQPHAVVAAPVAGEGVGIDRRQRLQADDAADQA